MSEFIARIKAELDTSAAEAKLKSLSQNQSLKLKVNLSGDSLNSFKSQINTFNNKKINISTNTSGISKAKSDFHQLKTLANEISQKKVKVANLDVSKNANQIKELSTQINKLESDYSVLSKTLGGSLNIDQVGKLNNILGKTDDKIAELNAKAKDLQDAMSLTKPFNTLDAITASNKTLSWLKNNTRATKELGEAFEFLAEKQKKATTQQELSDYNKEFRGLVANAQSRGLIGKSGLQSFKQSFDKIFQFSQIYGGINKVFEATHHAVSELKEVDSILTEISKVSDMTSQQIKQLGIDSFGYAEKYGKKITDYLQGVTEMNRSGFYGKQGVELADTSILAQAAGDMSADVANKYLLATNAAYQYAGSAEKLNAVLDGQNMITNRNSVNMTDMAEATTQAGSMAAQSGVQIDQLSALVGTAVARTKKDGNEIGTALKALFINLQNTSNSKITGTFDDLGISMTRMVNGSELLKTPIQLIKELSDAYNALPEGSTLRADILTNIGGKHHANVLSSVLSGYSDYEKMLKDYSEGSGSAAIEAEKSANNWEGSLNKLSNSWTKFIGNFVQSGQVTTGINGINSLVKSFDSLVNIVSPLGTIGAGAGIFAFVKNLG